MSYLDKVKLCNRWQPKRFTPFIVAGDQVGWITHKRAAILKKFDMFSVKKDGVALRPSLKTPKARSKAFKEIAADLRATGHFPGLRKELYAVKNRWSEDEYFRLDRGLVPSFGVRAYGVHVNGFVEKADGVHLWIGTRATDRMIEPGKRDNMVAGGQPAGLSLIKNVVKECEEEAAIKARRAKMAKHASVITYACERDDGLRADTLFCFDLEMPKNEKPKPSEEIVSFELMPLREVLRLVRNTNRFKFNVNLVVIDFAIRRGLITPENEKDFEEIVTGLHTVNPPVV